MTLNELIQRAVAMATAGIADLHLRLSIEAAAEPMLLPVFGEVGDELAADEHTRTLLRRTKNINVVDGSVTLASDVLTVYLCDSTLYDATDTAKRYSLCSWDEMVRGELDQRLGHYALEGVSVLHVVEPGDTFDPAGGDDIALRLTIPCSPVVPATLNAVVEVNDEVLDILITKLAQAIRPAVAAKPK